MRRQGLRNLLTNISGDLRNAQNDIDRAKERIQAQLDSDVKTIIVQRLQTIFTEQRLAGLAAWIADIEAFADCVADPEVTAEDLE